MQEALRLLYPYLPLSNLLASLISGLILLTRQKKNMAAVSLGLTAFLHTVMSACLLFTLLGISEPHASLFLKAGLAANALAIITTVIFSFSHVRLEAPLFPAIGRYVVPMVWAAGLFFCLYIFHPSFSGPQGILSREGLLHFGPGGSAFAFFMIISHLIVLFQMEQTYRAAKGPPRVRLKFLILGISFVSLYSLFLASMILLLRSVPMDLMVAGSIVYALCWVMMAFAVVRHRLLDVDIFLSRHVVFTSVAALGVGLYLVMVGVLGYFFRTTGILSNLFLLVLFVALALMALGLLLFAPNLEQRIRRFINVHFYRYSYDYRQEWHEFTRQISTGQDLNNLVLKVIELVSEILWVNQVTLWLYNDRSGVLSFTMSLNLPKKAEFIKGDTPLVRYLLDQATPLNVKDPAAEPIVAAHQGLLQRYNVAMMIPLKVGSRLVGMISLGPPIKRDTYSQEDAELMMILANQASSSIISAKLLDEIGTSKEAESFNKISSFLVHDLKNLASSLSLALQNADRNIGNPEFQQDLLGTLTDTVAKMKTLIEKLSTLPKELRIKKVPTDINDLIRDVIKRSPAESLRTVELTTDLHALVPVEVDGEYVRKVLGNLLLNSVQSFPNGTGRIAVSSYVSDGCINVEVVDTGIGMTEEFIKQQLFRPYRSTKKKGLGIGLYQCKAIMEAHGGDIEVHSIPNRGTQFVLRFPIQ
ncbi:MAG: PEP-CTERM system histidine kinase PrsK [bacterium]|nr:PEP-CTERM system histidine kinase PrsK [bacterium]